MYKDMEWLFFGTVRQFSTLRDFFEKKFFEQILFHAGPPARIFITGRTSYDACG